MRPHNRFPCFSDEKLKAKNVAGRLKFVDLVWIYVQAEFKLFALQKSWTFFILFSLVELQIDFFEEGGLLLQFKHLLHYYAELSFSLILIDKISLVH